MLCNILFKMFELVQVNLSWLYVHLNSTRFFKDQPEPEPNYFLCEKS